MKRSLWRDFTLNDGKAKYHDGRNRKISRETPEVLATALDTDDRKRRWELLKQYRAEHQRRCALKSWTWVESVLMEYDAVV